MSDAIFAEYYYNYTSPTGKLNIQEMKKLPILTAPSIANWNEQKTRLKARFAVLNYSDLQYAESRNDEMLARIQTKLGKTKEELAEIISAL